MPFPCISLVWIDQPEKKSQCFHLFVLFVFQQIARKCWHSTECPIWSVKMNTLSTSWILTNAMPRLSVSWHFSNLKSRNSWLTFLFHFCSLGEDHARWIQTAHQIHFGQEATRRTGHPQRSLLDALRSSRPSAGQLRSGRIRSGERAEIVATVFFISSWSSERTRQRIIWNSHLAFGTFSVLTRRLGFPH